MAKKTRPITRRGLREAPRPTATVRPAQEATEMADVKQTPDPMQFAGSAVETVALWADANQRILGQIADLGAGVAKDTARLYAELQQTTVDALRDSQASALRWQSLWPEAMKNPTVFYQQTLAESMEGAQKAFRLAEGNAQAIAKTAERWQASAEQAGRGIQETVKATVGKLKDVYNGK
jgi:hypothetical protein